MLNEGSNNKNITDIREYYRKIFEYYGIDEDVSNYDGDIENLKKVITVWDRKINEFERLNRSKNLNRALRYLGATKDQIVDPLSTKNEIEKDAMYRDTIKKIVSYLNLNYKQQLIREISSDSPYFNFILNNFSLFSPEYLSVNPRDFELIITTLEKIKSNSEFSEDLNWVEGLERNKNIEIERTKFNAITEIQSSYSQQEVDYAFNPQVLNEAQRDFLPLEGKLKSIRILAKYYDLDLPSDISEVELVESYYINKAAYIIHRKDDEADNIEDYVQDFEGEEGEEDVNLMEYLISKRKAEFLTENSDTAFDIFGFNWEEMYQKCLKKEKNQEEICEEVIYKLWQRFIIYVQDTFSTFKESDIEEFEQIIQNSLPLRLFSKDVRISALDDILFELNPIEFQKIIEKLEELRKKDLYIGRDKNWFESYRRSIRETEH